MKRILRGVLPVLCIVLVIGCSQQTSQTDPNPASITLTPTAGAFGLSHLKGLAREKKNAEIEQGPVVQFDLGKIKASNGFYFLLYNIGATPITGVTLSVEDEHYAVYPHTIDTLLPGSDVGMLPIVKLSVFHGTPLDGVGNRPLLPKGENAFTLFISGHTTTSDGRDTVIELAALMGLDAQVLDYELSTISGALQGGGSQSGNFINYPEMQGKQFNGYMTNCFTDSVVYFKNTGSEDIRIKIFIIDTTVDIHNTLMVLYMDTTVIASGSVNIPIFMFGTIERPDKPMPSCLVIYGNNTVADPQRITLDEDGNCYISVSSTPIDCETGAIAEPVEK